MTRLDLQPWMNAPATLRLMAALGEARFVGGAIRNTLLGKPVTDIDIATPLTPDKVGARLSAAGIAFVPTGIEHGTLTAIVEDKPFEVTTLRRDVTTDGRHAVVAFTEDWRLDAERRDFTMNALYAAADGEIFDYVGGIADLQAGQVRFVGDAVQRIREDYLRILRLFRFHAWYGRVEIDLKTLHAASAPKALAGLERNVSGERIRKEMLKLLEADDPVPALKTMGKFGILVKVSLPSGLLFERLKMLARIDAENSFKPDPLLRLAALLPNDLKEAKDIAEDWSFSNSQTARLTDLAGARETIAPHLTDREAKRLIYRLGARLFKDRVLLTWAGEPNSAVEWRALLKLADEWQRPRFPLTGRDVVQAGVPEGPRVGQILGEIEEWWIEHDFAGDVAERLKEAVKR